ncbi:uncharacterized protein F54H12.2-like [Nasonia vitripennis]|uniref:Uncharacterized protein n=1 Tax=Nasonia vitripennis TaxID=7425 RepID=A0A7M7Q7I4_NASVI|nr:uncharacterized protein F54H12.2-like [Nasonia vitripennis]
MAFLHSHSTECMSSELYLFTLPATQTSIESSSFLHYKPVSSLSDDVDAPLEFVVPASSEHYFDLAHTMIHVHAKIKTPPNNAYPYKAYIETLLNYAPAANESHLTSSLRYDDTSGGFDSPANAVSTGTAPMIVNKGIKEATLIVRRVKISPGVLLAHAQALSKTTAKYPITRVEVKSFTLNSGILGDSIDNVIHGQLPKRIILGFVENKAFNGNRALNPFNFQHFSINYIFLYVDGVQIPSKPLQPRFTGLDKLYIDAFQTLYTGTGVHVLNEDFGINRYNYYKGNFLTAFDLTPDLSAHCGTHWNLVRSGRIRIEVRFETALLTAINCIVYAEYDNVLEIDSSRQIEF